MQIQVIINSSRSSQLGELTYSVPSLLQSQIQVGSAIRVKMRNKLYAGLVTKIHEKEIETKFKTSDIEQIIYATPLLSKEQIALARYISNYYCCSFYKAISLFLPTKVWNGSYSPKREISYNISSLAKPSELSDFIEINQKRAKKMTALLNYIIEKKSVCETLIREQVFYSTSSLKNLIEKGFVIREELELKVSLENSDKTEIKDHRLTDEQEIALKTIQRSEKNKFLIHGITGSGKTEIYLRLAREAVQGNQQTLILVPEISLTPQFIKYFQNEFGNELSIIHSKLSEGEKCQEWWRIRHNESKIVIGSRSALFSPFQKLKYLIIDEEHSWTYKQDQAPRYHARDLCFKIISDIDLNNQSSKLILGSATPSIETYYQAKTGAIELIELKNRVKHHASKLNNQLPKSYLVDLRQELRSGNFSIFSQTLLDKISKTIEEKGQVILFLNRRGSSSSVICRDCGYICKCRTCETPLTYHTKANSNYLQCHYCGLIEATPLKCPNCKSTRIKFVGIGTQKVETEIKKLFPKVRVARADSDTTTQKHAFKKIYQDMKDHQIDILVGTQMIAKGLHLPKVNLIGIILADLGLSIPDFRSQEKTFQLLSQVSGRAGRGKEAGEVVIQTYNPDNFTLQSIKNHDYQALYEYEIKSREELLFPPFSSLIKLTYVDLNAAACEKEAKRIYKEAESKIQTSKFTSPTQPFWQEIQNYLSPPLYPRIHGKYHYNVWLKGEKEEIQKILHQLDLTKGWRIDIDPIGI